MTAKSNSLLADIAIPMSYQEFKSNPVLRMADASWPDAIQWYKAAIE
jgi:hypothetical protein